jgi:hypothetical protein
MRIPRDINKVRTGKEWEACHRYIPRGNTMNNKKELLLSEQTRYVFKKTFGQDIRAFFNQSFLAIGIIDFDIIAFDEWLKVPDGISTYNFLVKNYSQETADFIRSLL